MAASDSMKCGDTSKSNGRQADTVDLVMKLLFDHIAPPLLVARNLSKLIAYVWKWVYVPNLEGNVQWVKEALSHFFSIDDSRVVLADKMVGGGARSSGRKDVQEIRNAECDTHIKESRNQEVGFLYRGQ